MKKMRDNIRERILDLLEGDRRERIENIGERLGLQILEIYRLCIELARKGEIRFKTYREVERIR